MSKIKETEVFKLNRFKRTVTDVSSRMPQFPRTVAGRQIHISCSASSLHVINSLFDLFRENYRTVNDGDALAIVAKYFMENVKEEDESDEEV
jgi:hypothetical protein